MRTLLLLTLSLAACTASSDTDGNEDGIPQPLDNPFPYDDSCDGFDGTPVAGAWGWWVGDFRVDGDSVEGYEVWALLTNDEWASGGEGRDCQLTYNINGLIGPTQNCASCDFSVEIDATINHDASDCHDAFVLAHDDPYSVTYNVRTTSSGVTEVLFAASGNPVGEGSSNNRGFNFTSNPRCFASSHRASP